MGSSEQTPLEVDDLIVLIMGAPAKSPSLQNRLEGATRVEKLIFLIDQESDIRQEITESPDFFAHNFGPFSAKVYQAIDTLVAAGLVRDSAAISSSTEDAWEEEEVIGTMTSDPYATRTFELTERGRRYYSALIRALPPSTELSLERFKDRFGTLPLRQLIRYVYQKYPEYTDKSLIRDQVLGH